MAPARDDTHLEERLKAWREEQYRVASQVIVQPDPEMNNDARLLGGRFKCVVQYTSSPKNDLYGGVDVSFPSNSEEHPALAVYVIIDASTMKVVYQDYEYFELNVPYVSSYLSFREIDPLQRLVEKQLSQKPTLTPSCILVDGNGILHERRAGIACFLGVRTGIPTIGVGKTLYCQGGLTNELVKEGIDASLLSLQEALNRGVDEWNEKLQNCEQNPTVIVDSQCIGSSAISEHASEPQEVDRRDVLHKLSEYHFRGFATKLCGSDGKILAAALVGHGGVYPHSKTGTKNPIFVSVGHDISLEQALVICASLSMARIPEPVRQADLMGRELLRQQQQTL